jgi:hypothetical protein
MSALGRKRTSRGEFAMSALPPKADIAERDQDVRFVPIADIARATPFGIKEPPTAASIGHGFAQTRTI